MTASHLSIWYVLRNTNNTFALFLCFLVYFAGCGFSDTHMSEETRDGISPPQLKHIHVFNTADNKFQFSNQPRLLASEQFFLLLVLTQEIPTYPTCNDDHVNYSFQSGGRSHML